MKHIPTIKQHPWFAMLHWNDLIARTVKPPFVPELDGDSDVSHFASQFTMCSVKSHNESFEESQAYEGFSFKRSNSSPELKPLEPESALETETEFTLTT